MQVARDYGVLIEEDGVALRGLFIIDPKGILRQITINDLPVGRSVEETLRLVKAFQFTVSAVLLPLSVIIPRSPGPSVSFFLSWVTLGLARRTSTARSAPRTGPRAPRR